METDQMKVPGEINETSARARLVKAGGKVGLSPPSSAFKSPYRAFKPRAISGTDWSIFFGALARMLEAGIDLSCCFDSLSTHSSNKRLASIAATVSRSISQGTSLSVACRAPEFKPLHKVLVLLGEQTGSLPLIFDKLAAHEREQSQISLKIRAAGLYPLVMLSVFGGLLVFLPTVLRQPFSLLLATADVEMSWLLSLIFGLSTFLSDIRLWAGFAILILVYRTPLAKLLSFRPVKEFIWRLGARIPVIKVATRALSENRLAATLALTYQAGLPPDQAFEQIARMMPSPFYEKACLEVVHSLRQGEGLATSLGSTSLFSKTLLAFVEAGEQSGRLPELLMSYSNLLSLELDETIKRALSLLDPIFLAGMALLVLVLGLSVLTPLSKVVQAI